MRFVVMTDLIGTITLPSSVVYLIYLIYESVSGAGPLPVIALGMLAGAYGLQALIFIIKRQWQHIGWMVIYVLAIPIFSFFIPIYAFWHFDDFSWGNTRVVVGDNKKKQIIVTTDGEKFDEKMIPLKKWAQHEQALYEEKVSAKTRSIHSFATGYSKRRKGDDDGSTRMMNEKGQQQPQQQQNSWLLQPLIMDFSLQGDNPFSFGDYTAGTTAIEMVNTGEGASLEQQNGVAMETMVVLPEDDAIEREIGKILMSANLMDLTKKQGKGLILVEKEEKIKQTNHFHISTGSAITALWCGSDYQERLHQCNHRTTFGIGIRLGWMLPLVFFTSASFINYTTITHLLE
jgi:chitin synthase